MSVFRDDPLHRLEVAAFQEEVDRQKRLVTETIGQAVTEMVAARERENVLRAERDAAEAQVERLLRERG